MFSETDLQQIKDRGSNREQIEHQVGQFKTGFPYLNIKQVAAAGSGILRLEETEVNRYIAAYDQLAPVKEVLKFVPASGAASRMFKALFAHIDTYSGSDEDVAAMEADKGPKSMFAFFAQLKEFAFFDELKEAAGGGNILEEWLAQKEYVKILEALLTSKGLGYGSLPKGLLTFHQYDTHVRTPLEEHLVEGALYAKGAGDIVQLHLTVSPEHQDRFSAQLKKVLAHYESTYGVRYEISFSQQKAATDTIAVDLGNEPFRNPDGSLLFRPAGHGALLENLNEIDADIIFIKNIDNVVPDRIKADTIRYKKALAGVLLVYQRRLFDYLQKLIEAEDQDEALLGEVLAFIEQDLCVVAPENLSALDWEAQKTYALEKLNRPIRVCGMVVNEGEPGGGPFWVGNEDGSTSLQIVESAQIDSKNAAQQDLMQQSTHFNPVDLVCSPRDRKGKKFDLIPFRDPNTGFISQKSKDGKDLKALELPGLWNGAMANWNTLFVEVPAITFNPVKIVQDLLREEHQ